MAGRRLKIGSGEPCPTVMAGGVGDVNTGQYTVEEGTAPPAAAGKPPYRVPLVSEVAGYPKNGFTVVSFFSGCGGSCFGYEMAGYEVLWANEFIRAARDTYRLNHPGVILNKADIRKLDPEKILERIGKKIGEVDVVEGSPPCASFSTAGKREKDWGKVKKYSDSAQRTDDLFFEFVRMLDGIRPKVFTAENVSGLVKGSAKGYFLEILAALRKVGYRVRSRLLDAQWLGVPQARQRIIFIGVREDLGLEPVFPQPLPYRYSVLDAIPWLAGGAQVVHGRVGGSDDVTERAAGTVRAKRSGHLTIQQGNGGGFGGESWKGVDEPSATVGAGPTSGNGRSPAGTLRIVQQQGAVGVDEPAPTILGKPPRDAKQAGTLAVVQGASVGYGRQKWKGIDEPSGTILVDPYSSKSQAGAVGSVPAGELTAVEPEADISRYAIGREAEKLKPGKKSSKYLNLVKPKADEPCPTITQVGGSPSAASVVHPVERRKFSIAELRRVCGFPDDFRLTGSYSQQWERLGRAVPPPMMRAIAESVRDGILRRQRPPLLIGEADNGAGRPFGGRSGEALAKLLGLKLDDFLGRVEAVNLLKSWPGKQGKGDAFPAEKARRAAEKLDLEGRLVIAAGKRVARALGIADPEWFAQVEHRGAGITVIPHPSGVVTWWNDPANRRRAAGRLRALVLGN